MHLALSIDDIIASICQFLGRQELARLARTSKAMQTVAFERLWAKCASLDGLVLQLPPMSMATDPYNLVRHFIRIQDGQLTTILWRPSNAVLTLAIGTYSLNVLEESSILLKETSKDLRRIHSVKSYHADHHESYSRA